MLKLSKRILAVPARTETIIFEWCHKDFVKMGPDFRRGRSRSRNKLDKCWWCNHKFADGEMITLAHPKGKINKVLCQKCASELQAEEGSDD